MEKARNVVRQAYNDERQVILVQMADPENAEGYEISQPLEASHALELLEQMQPMPWAVDYGALTSGMNALVDGEYGASFWLSSGLDHENALAFSNELKDKAPLQYFENGSDALPIVIDPAEYENGDYRLTIRRAAPEDSFDFSIGGYAQDGTLLAKYDYSFAEGQSELDVFFDVPELSSSSAISSDIFRFSVEGEKNAAASVIVDDQWRPRSVGLVVQNRAEAESLLSESRFIKTAIAPHSEMFMGSIEELIESGDISVLVIPDAFTISSAAAAKI